MTDDLPYIGDIVPVDGWTLKVVGHYGKYGGPDLPWYTIENEQGKSHILPVSPRHFTPTQERVEWLIKKLNSATPRISIKNALGQTWEIFSNWTDKEIDQAIAEETQKS
jgi:hypothetical protein